MVRTRHSRRVALVLALAMAVTAVGVAPGAAGGASDGPYAWPVPSSQVRAAVRSVDGIVRRVRRASGVPGIAVAVVAGGRVVRTAGYGVANTRTGRRVGPDTAFEVASLSKPIGATVIARLVDAHRIAWTDAVRSHLPAFTLADPYVTANVTLEDMYAQRSGLPEHAGDLLADLGYDGPTVLARLRHLPLGPFRARYAFTNFGVAAAAESVAAAAGTPWPELSAQQLYRPLGLTHTTSRYDEFAADPDHADPHVREGSHWRPRFTRDADVDTAASGVASSARDLGRWLAMLAAHGVWRGRRILSRAEVTNLQTPRIATGRAVTLSGPARQYSLGFDVSVDATGRVRLGHSGASALGVGSAFALSPAAGVGIVVLTDAAPVGAAEAITAEFMDRALVGRATRDWYPTYRAVFARLSTPAGSLGDTPPDNPQPPLAAAAYVGTYANAFYGPLQVVARGPALVMQLGPRPEEFPLRHWAGNTFAYVTRGEHASGTQPVDFTVVRGRVTAVTVGDLDAAAGPAAHLGTFARVR